MKREPEDDGSFFIGDIGEVAPKNWTRELRRILQQNRQEDLIEGQTHQSRAR